MQFPPLATDLPPEALRVLAQSTVLQTPCGEGTMAWHAWGSGEPVFLLHGGSGSWTHWVRNVEALAAAGRRVFAADLPGFGDSAALNRAADADTMVAPVALGIRQLGGDGPHDVVGFSFGGLLSGLLAQAHPAMVRRLVLVGAPGLGLRNSRLPLVPWRHLESTAERAAAHHSNLAMLMLHRPESIDDLAVAVHIANTARDRVRRRGLALTDILARTLTTLDCPVDAIYGEQDALYADMLPELKRLLTSFACVRELVLIPGGHWVQYENAPAFNRELLALLARAPEAGPPPSSDAMPA